PRASAITSAIVVLGDATAAPAAAAAVALARSSSPGPHRITDISPRRLRNSSANAANRSGGQRLLGQAAPGLSNAYAPPVCDSAQRATFESTSSIGNSGLPGVTPSGSSSPRFISTTCRVSAGL